MVKGKIANETNGDNRESSKLELFSIIISMSYINDVVKVYDKNQTMLHRIIILIVRTFLAYYLISTYQYITNRCFVPFEKSHLHSIHKGN